MLRAHRQAWAWQDEWHGLSMEDIREIERQTQLALKRKMGQMDDDNIGTFFALSYVNFSNSLSPISQFLRQFVNIWWFLRRKMYRSFPFPLI